MADEQWLSFDAMLETVRRRLECSIGRAGAIIKAALASGEVRQHKPRAADPILVLDDDGIVGLDMRPGAQHKAGVSSEGRPLVHRLNVSLDGKTPAARFSKEDFLDWLDRHYPRQANRGSPTQRRSVGGKRPRILRYLESKFRNKPVPEPGLCPRKQLIDDVLKADPTLKPLDEATMKRAIDAHNASVGKPGR